MDTQIKKDLTVQNPPVAYTKDDISTATYNALRKLAKQYQIKMVKGRTTAQDYRLALLALLPTELPETSDNAVKKAPTGDIVAIRTLTLGDIFRFKSAKKKYTIIDTDEAHVRVRNETGTEWWMRKPSELDRQVVCLGKTKAA